MIKRLTLVLAAALLALGFAAARPASALADGNDDGNGGTNAAIAINTKDGTSIFKLAFAIKRVAGDVVDQTNAAVAYSSCNDCQSIAISIEIVLVTGSPSVVTPTNLAIAINDQCTTCVSVAEAYQFVFGTGGEVHFTEDGKRALREIRHDLKELGKQDMTLVELQAKLDGIVARIRDVLRNELVPSGKSGDHESGSNGNESTTPASTLPAATTPTSTEPAGTDTTPTTTTETTPTTTTDTTPTTTTTTG